MTQEEKQLLLKDLCARLPYGVRINHIIYGWEGNAVNFNKKLESFAIEKDNGLSYDVPVEEVHPYLRPMSSMTEEEIKECKHLIAFSGSPDGAANLVDWLNKKMFAYHTIDGKDMFKLGLALEAPEGMYKEI